LKVISVGCGIPWDTRYDDFFVVPIGGVVGHFEGLKLFHVLPSGSQRFLILVQPKLAMVRLSLKPHSPKGRLVMLKMRGLLKMGCMRTSA
jgi:hypothetical protein